MSRFETKHGLWGRLEEDYSAGQAPERAKSVLETENRDVRGRPVGSAFAQVENHDRGRI